MSEEGIDYEILSDDFSKFDLTLKIIIIGDSGVGKSCLLLKGIRNYYEEFYSPTVGFEFFSFNIRVNNINMKLQIWDTCGQEIYRSLVQNFYRNSSLAMIVYAINDRNSFNNIENWLNGIKDNSNPNIKVFLIGNKADLEDSRQVSLEESKQFSLDNGFDYFIETSAKTGVNAQKLFIQAAIELYKMSQKLNNNNNQENNLIISNEDEKSKRKHRCC